MLVKSFQKVVQSSSRVDDVFVSQGFKKVGRKDFPYYRLKVADLSTRTNYEVQIPIHKIGQGQAEPLYKIYEMTIHPKDPYPKKHPIPDSVVHAAQEKVRETLSYLTRDPRLSKQYH